MMDDKKEEAMSPKLPEQAEAVYTFIQQYYQENQTTPLQREIADACRLNRSRVVRAIDYLEAKGRVERVHTTRRLVYRPPGEG
jgi:DNA-binding MarR family transcriptional regulator